MRKYLMTLFHEIYLDHVYASQPAHHQSINIFSKTQSLFFRLVDTFMIVYLY
jgi:hypothetical protein